MIIKKYIYFGIIFFIIRQLTPKTILGKKINLYNMLILSAFYAIGKYMMDSYMDHPDEKVIKK